MASIGNYKVLDDVWVSHELAHVRVKTTPYKIYVDCAFWLRTATHVKNCRLIFDYQKYPWTDELIHKESKEAYIYTIPSNASTLKKGDKNGKLYIKKIST